MTTASNDESGNSSCLASMMRVVTDRPVSAARRSKCFSIAGVTSIVEVQTRSSANDQYAVARSEPQSVNRQTSNGVESRRADEGIVRRRPDRVPQSIPHHASQKQRAVGIVLVIQTRAAPLTRGRRRSTP